MGNFLLSKDDMILHCWSMALQGVEWTRKVKV